MADERDPKVSQRYRELSREEPSPQIDAAILAAARREAETRPAPLVVPTGRRRWYFPLAAAAIIVLAVAVTMHVEREQPDPEIAVAPVTVPEAQREEQAAQSRILKEEPAQPAPARKAAPPQVFAPDPKPQASSAQADSREPAPAAAAPPELRAQRDAPASAPAADEMRRREAAVQERAQQQRATEQGPARQERAAAGVRESQRADAPSPMAKQAVEPPEKWLERIAELRRQGKHEEADRALAEFRKRYPDYKISAEMLERVERR